MKVDHIYNKSCEKMDDLPDGSVNLVVTSPPYFNLRDYSVWKYYEDHLHWLRSVIEECYRVLSPGAWMCWNIQECIPMERDKSQERQGTYPLLAHTISIMEDAGFFYEKDIVWYKGKGTATQKLFGSYPNPSLILVSGLTEHIITARKPLLGQKKRTVSKEVKEKSELTKQEWGAWAVDLWEIPPVPSKSTSHPAPYPVELANRCIRLNSFWGDVVLDPFMGSGTTAIAAKQAGRHYIGYEMHEKYAALANKRIGNDMDIFDGRTK